MANSPLNIDFNCKVGVAIIADRNNSHATNDSKYQQEAQRF